MKLYNAKDAVKRKCTLCLLDGVHRNRYASIGRIFSHCGRRIILRRVIHGTYESHRFETCRGRINSNDIIGDDMIGITLQLLSLGKDLLFTMKHGAHGVSREQQWLHRSQ